MPAKPAVPRRSWELLSSDETAATSLAKHLGCPGAIARLLVTRGIGDAEAADRFFGPSLDQLDDPMRMLGMAEAMARIQQAVQDGEPILIYGDYDVDGTTATVLLKTAIERIAPKDKPARVTWHVPHRIREGYGMQTNVLGRAAEDGIRLIISVDTGIRAFAAATEAKLLGLDLIVTDHHLPDDAIGVPEALAVINPAQEGCPYPFKSLCGAGVAFKLAHALLAAAAETEEQRERLQRVILPSFLKLVAIATVADSVPLVGENRVIAALGLHELRNPVQPGLRALMEVAKLPLDRAPSATEIGFRLAPRINAAGRMDVADDVIELFLTRDSARAKELAEKLDLLNQDRRATEADALDAIEKQLDALRTPDGDYPRDCIILDDPAWHRGVLGILASRVVDRTGRPALILTHEEGQAHGSGRSVEGFHLLDALTAVDAQPDAEFAGGVFTRFGGHAHAVGFSMPSHFVGSLRARMLAYTSTALTPTLLSPPLACDAELDLDEITPAFWEWLGQCGPFGNAHPEPIFVTKNLQLAAPARLIKEKHICLDVMQNNRLPRFNVLGWSRNTNWVARCHKLNLQQGSSVDIAYRIKENQHPQFGGLQLELVELEPA
ncbi:single-stranded-DNA-specific exonuclease RecJ [Granulicella arctica]|uniref:Single-stranded-DNA-specific exonuclease RecJ n=1 Tax=Granulicella arctica TaxID=940613 RepID=A0A7Y9PIT9_9BACT|nr:single-stranded-DNA-specific exonuclease RecJ [Granulicella arctica]NYF79878.1 single-stranded-DNA-specific exonuclease [Granulicella arctica]